MDGDAGPRGLVLAMEPAWMVSGFSGAFAHDAHQVVAAASVAEQRLLFPSEPLGRRLTRVCVLCSRDVAIDTGEDGAWAGRRGEQGRRWAIRFQFHSTSFCLPAATTAGQSCEGSGTRDYREITQKLSFPRVSRAVGRAGSSPGPRRQGA